MKINMDQSTEKSMNVFRGFAGRTSISLAVIAAVFSLVVGGLLFTNYLQRKLYDPLRAERLEALKLKLVDYPNNQQLQTDIRVLDLELRKTAVYRLNFSRRASVLLLFGVGISLACWKTAGSLKQKLPVPVMEHDVQAHQIGRVNSARWAVTVGFAVLCGAGLFLVRPDAVEFEQQGPAWPTWRQWLENWPVFRGPQGSGVSAYDNIPTYWNESKGQGIIWKSKVTLPGHNSPVVWGDKIFICGADQEQQQVYCYDATDGELLWEQPVLIGIDEELEVMEDTGYAAPTMAVDDKRAYAIFATGDIAAFDHKGRLKWSKNLGLQDNMYGYSSSLCMYENLLIIQYDQGTAEDGLSRMIALDSFSGSVVWEINRPVGSSWSSPIVVEAGKQMQLITCSNPYAIAYDPKSGDELWRAECLGDDVGASPIYSSGLAIVISPYEHIKAIRADGRGDVTETHIIWESMEGLPDICSPVTDGEFFYTLTTPGKLTCFELETGKLLWEKELKTNFQASPGLVGDKIYLMSEKGETIIIKSGREYEELGRCKLDEGGLASPAFMDGRIYVRTKDHLYCLGAGN